MTVLELANFVVIFLKTLYRTIAIINRECASHAIVFRQFSKNTIEAIYNSFGQRFDSEKQFKKYLNQNTGNYSFVFVNNESLEDNLHDA